MKKPHRLAGGGASFARPERAYKMALIRVASKEDIGKREAPHEADMTAASRNRSAISGA